LETRKILRPGWVLDHNLSNLSKAVFLKHGFAEQNIVRGSERNNGINTRWFRYDRDDLCVNKSQFVPVIFEPPCT
jgi:hypothetical protein